jgi:hypothetical protein
MPYMQSIYAYMDSLKPSSFLYHHRPRPSQPESDDVSLWTLPLRPWLATIQPSRIADRAIPGSRRGCAHVTPKPPAEACE